MTARGCEASVLDDFYWQALVGSQRRFTLGTSTARRFAPGFAPLTAFAVPQQPDFDALAPHCRAGERLHCVGWDGATPAGWRIESQSILCRMVWDAPSPSGDAGIETMRLGPLHLSQALDLAERARPGMGFRDYCRHTVRVVSYLGTAETC